MTFLETERASLLSAQHELEVTAIRVMGRMAQHELEVTAIRVMGRMAQHELEVTASGSVSAGFRTRVSGESKG